MWDELGRVVWLGRSLIQLQAVMELEQQGRSCGCWHLLPELSGPLHLVSPRGLLGLPHSMVAQPQRPVSRENHAEATLPFVTQLKSQNIVFASSSLPGLEGRKHGRNCLRGRSASVPL